MKIAVGLLALCLALCHAAPAFEEGKKYTYEYEGRFGTGVSDNAVTQFSGKGWKGLLHVYYHEKELAVQFSNLKTGEFNKRLPNVYDVVDIHYEETDALKKHEDTFWADYEDGRITASKHPKDADYDDLNCKRAILGILQTVFPENPEHEHFYHVKESGIGGDCDTTYVVNHLPYDGNPDAVVLNVTKNRSYDKCSYRPHEFRSSLTGYKCTHCKEDDFKPLKAFGRVEYQIAGTKKKYTIEKIQANGLISFTPFTTNGQTIYSITNQTLHLVKVEDGSLLSAPADAKKIEGLSFKFHDEDRDHDHEDIKQSHFDSHEKAAKLALAEKYLPPLDFPFSEYHRLADYVYQLADAFQFFNYVALENFYKKHINMKENATPAERDRRIFVFKILPLVGTNAAIKFLIDCIKNNQIPDTLVMEAIGILPFYARTPSGAIVDEYYNFVTSDLFSKNPASVTSSAAWLSFGSFVYKGCVKDDFNPHPHHHETYISEAKCHQYVKDLIKKFESASTSEEKCIYVRAIKNTQTKDAFDFLVKEIINTHKYNSFIREAAIWGMEHFVPQYKEEVTEALVPIFTDIHEDYSLRLYAFDVLVYTAPTPLFFANLVIGVNKEPNMQVASYIYSSLATFANSTDPCYEDVAKHARHVLPFIKNKHFDVIRHSTNKIYSFYNEKYGFGRTSQFVWVASNDTAFPRELYMRQALNIAGYNFDFMEVGVIQRENRNFDSFLAVILQQYNLMLGPKIAGEDYNLAKHIDFDAFTSNAAYEVYSRMFNQDVVVAHDLKVYDNAYVTEIGVNKYDIHFTKVMSVAEIQYYIPNEMGFDAVLFLHVPIVAKLHGTIEVKIVEGGVEFNLDLNYGFNMEIKGGMDVIVSDAGLYGYGVDTNFGVKFPLRGVIHYNSETREVTTKEMVSTEPYDIIHYHTHPFTYTDDDHTIPVVYSEKPVNRQYKWGHDYFGAGLKFQFEYDYYWNDYGSYRNFFKTFFHKSTRYEDYFDLADKWYAGSRGFLDYVIFNPTARPFDFKVRFEQSTTNPATEYVYSYKKKQTPYYDESRTGGDHTYSTKDIELDIVAKGPVERKWNAELKVDRHWPVTDLRKVTFLYRRTALPHYDEKPYEMCFTSETKIHGAESIHTKPLKDDHDVGIDYTATLNVGETCGAGSRQVQFKGAAKSSEEHDALDKDKLPIYQKCKEDYEKGHEYSYACWLVMKDQGRLDKFVVDIEYSKNISPNVKACFYRLWLWFRHTFYNNLKVELEPNSHIPENHLQIVANFSYYHPVADVHLYRPHETVHYHNIFVPSVIPLYEPVTIMKPSWDHILKRAFNFHKPMCFLSGDHVYTLDAVQYKYKLGNCYHVALADCVNEDIVVMYKHVDDGKFTKAMKVVLYKTEIEVKPEGDHLVAYVDGSKIDDSKPAYFKKTDDDKIGYAVYKMFNSYVVDSKPSGLQILFDGRNTMITVSNLFRGRQCGMCGDFNGDKVHEFRSIDGKLHKDGSEFAHSYAIHKDDCHA